ncbi:MAG TPA: hypothetical protein K8V00_09175 [Ligilactobacillus acidipiscis]|uniref:Uncharacterized protein n=1 Tax=Ligilactobacillus acidipiscis TaxID=89059 RepID=A0A921K1E1_9LACO|nr:hypothetical protein [Ligilactobacillus acidipiscis]
MPNYLEIVRLHELGTSQRQDHVKQLVLDATRFAKLLKLLLPKTFITIN